jgi:hypothetical protein
MLNSLVGGKRALKRQRTILGIVLREIGRKRTEATLENSARLSQLDSLLARAERIRNQRPKDKDKLYALHASEVERIGKARKRYEFGVTVGIAVTHKQGLIVGARAYPGNPYDGHILREQLEQVSVLLEDVGVKPKQAVVDLGFRGVDGDNPGVEILHRGKTKRLSLRQRQWLKRRLGERTGDWIFEGGASNGAVLAERRDGRCLACRALRGGLQLALADARGGAPGADRSFCALVLFVRLAKFRLRLLVG